MNVSPIFSAHWNKMSLFSSQHASFVNAHNASCENVTATQVNTSNINFIPQYNVGDTGPGGGVVFYISPAGFLSGPNGNTLYHYLEAAPAGWNGTPNDPTAAGWSGNTTNAVGTSLFTGAGAGNTARAIAQNNTPNTAIALAASYSNNGKDDWFLPSLDELDIVSFYKNVIGGIFAGGTYWSSSENISNKVWAINFDSSYVWPNAVKSDTGTRVRPIRAF